MYKIDDTIPGWSDVEKLKGLAELASNVKEGGLIVEVGSFCGRSAYAMGMNKDDSVKLLCVDMFIDEWLTNRKVEDYPGTETCYGDKSQMYSYDTFIRNTNEVKNLDTIRMVFPYDEEYFSFNKKIDLLFIDATHTYDAVRADIEQWCPHLKDDAVVVFDDYCDQFQGCIDAVNEYAQSVGSEIKIIAGTAAKVVL